MDLDLKIPLWHKDRMDDAKAPNKIRELREAKGWSQQQLADAIFPATNQSQIDRLEKGIRKLTQDWMQRVSKPLGVDAAALLPKPAREHNREEDTQGEVARPNLQGLQFPVGAQTVESWPKDLKIIGHAKAGQRGFFLDQGEYHGMAYRPPALSTVKDAFAIYVHDDSMEPAFEPGQIAWVHPTRPVAPGNNIIIEMTDGQAFIKRLVRRTEKFIVCKQWNPAAETKFDTSKIKRLYYVVGSYRED